VQFDVSIKESFVSMDHKIFYHSRYLFRSRDWDLSVNGWKYQFAI